MAMENRNHRLPEELIYEILLRVPADSLARPCKLVCKAWRTIIDDSTFVHTQATRDKKFDHSSSFILSRYRRTYHHNEQYLSADFHIGEFNDDHETWTRKTMACFQESERAIKHHLDDDIVFHPPTYSTKFEPLGIVGSCNGLVCFCRIFWRVALVMTVVNPLTGEYITIPRCIGNRTKDVNWTGDHLVLKDNKYSKVAYGFGYVPCTKEYKIVIIFYDEKRRFVKDVQVYTLGSGRSWRCSRASKQGITNDYVHFRDEVSRGMLVDGALHWMNSLESTIISFDLAKEELGVLPSPGAPMPELSLRKGRNQYFKLGVLEGCLSVKCVNNQNPEIDDIWILKKTTWIKKFDVVLSFEIARSANYTPLAVSTSGKLLLLVSSTNSLVNYDPQTSSCELVKGCLGLDIIAYRKSLVSLKAWVGEGEPTEWKWIMSRGN